MNTASDEFAGWEAKLPTLREEYRASMQAFTSMPQSGVKIEDVRNALWRWHHAAIDYFNAFERSISLGSVVVAAQDSTWYTDKCETAENLLEVIANHYATVLSKADDLNIPRAQIKPGRTSFANMQRLVKRHARAEASNIRDKWLAQGLPTTGFDAEESDQNRPQKLETRYFVIGCIILFLAVLLGVWTFAIGNLTTDQRNVLRAAFALMSGFLSWSFAGTISITGNHPVAKVLVAATGGFAVWFLTYFLFGHG